MLAQTDFYGNLRINSVYQTENDIADQYAVLQEVYTALGGEYWSAVYQQTTGLEEVLAYEETLSTTSKQFNSSRNV